MYRWIDRQMDENTEDYFKVSTIACAVTNTKQSARVTTVTFHCGQKKWQQLQVQSHLLNR